jgi:hypothetical protein
MALITNPPIYYYQDIGGGLKKSGIYCRLISRQLNLNKFPQNIYQINLLLKFNGMKNLQE